MSDATQSNSCSGSSAGSISSWHVVARSVRGASHARINLSNQDAFKYLPESGDGLPIVLAVADGHGSESSLRSEIGARLAVDVACEVIGTLVAAAQPARNRVALGNINEQAKERLPHLLVRSWLQKIEEHFDENPFSDEERKRLGLLPSNHASKDEIVRTAYGSTLTAVAVGDGFVLYLQIGDGDVLTVDAFGHVTRPLPRDERNMANETTSLCSKQSWNDFRVMLQAWEESPPSLILVATDGYSNSFAESSGFMRAGADLVQMIRAHGLQKVGRELPTWLADASRLGSGDDITLGIIKHSDEFDADTVNGRIVLCEAAQSSANDRLRALEEKLAVIPSVTEALTRLENAEFSISRRLRADERWLILVLGLQAVVICLLILWFLGDRSARPGARLPVNGNRVLGTNVAGPISPMDISSAKGDAGDGSR